MECDKTHFYEIYGSTRTIYETTPQRNGFRVSYTDLIVENQSMRNSADVSPVRHGRWRFCGSDKWNDAYECSECGNIAMDDSNYCPNCGAKMIRGNDNG